MKVYRGFSAIGGEFSTKNNVNKFVLLVFFILRTCVSCFSDYSDTEKIQFVLSFNVDIILFLVHKLILYYH